ncbi:MAG: hypothetical protein JO235_28380 [Chroococcidiopsidaceae cyanobacterium CP_BM_RX_35]|nr:hypothetical protein [Chroococcidiopsidaceae cyanobacterium CP_BM_RX_35]
MERLRRSPLVILLPILFMALHVPLVFARDRLAEYLEQHQTAYIPWNDFFDVRDRLAKLWNGNQISAES